MSTDLRIQCGIGTFKPNCLQCCATLKIFTVFYSISALMTSTLSVYIASQITTIEKQFGFTSTQSGLLMSCNDIGYLAVTLFVSYFADILHAPRVLSFSTLLFGAAGIICAIPYFVSPMYSKSILSKTSNVSRSGDFFGKIMSSGQLCKASSTFDQLNSNMSCSSQSDSNTFLGVANEFTPVAMTLIAIGMIVQGIGKSPRNAFITTYIDNNVKKTQTAVYIGKLTKQQDKDEVLDRVKRYTDELEVYVDDGQGHNQVEPYEVVEIGVPGPPGKQGVKGMRGYPGLAGDPGKTGRAGPRGSNGAPGTKGDMGGSGKTGKTGERGPAGSTGEKGMDGLDGTNGMDGAKGSPGDDGIQGAQGEIGPAGETGTAGEPGQIGPSGPTGPPGPKGDMGLIGQPGAQGGAGRTGDQGNSGSRGELGQTGPPGPTGPKGDSGSSGCNGIECADSDSSDDSDQSR